MNLDHAVINTRYNLDAAEQHFAALGFQQTPRGYHSLGSTNHLMMFGTDYLELIGLPEPAPGSNEPRVTRAGVSDAPVGINGLVFKTEDAHATYRHLQQLGMAGEAPKSFSRPVDLNDGKPAREARFTTVHVRPDCFPAGRVYFCQHHTPELVWQPQWQSHPNGATAISAMTLVAGNSEQQADDFARLLAVEAENRGNGEFSIRGAHFQLNICTPATYAARFGSLASPGNDRSSFFGALQVRTQDMAAAERIAQAATTAGVAQSVLGWHGDDDQQGLLVRQPDFDTLLIFSRTEQTKQAS